ncbi:MAG TPA: hypothetical protein VHS09_10965 [Polyangiaceae bacterium]|jgi:hypothetical protein|nr:hypothetical protein [Polyangiaceae bacterium]
MTDEPLPEVPKTPWRRYFAGPIVGAGLVLVVAVVAWLRGCPVDPPRPAGMVDEASVDLPDAVPVEFGGRRGVLVGGKVVLEPLGVDGGGRGD